MANDKGKINFANKSIDWPGRAAVKVTLLALSKGSQNVVCRLGQRNVEMINPFLEEGEEIGNPKHLSWNQGKVFNGSCILGDGFLTDEKFAKELINSEPHYSKILFP